MTPPQFSAVVLDYCLAFSCSQTSGFRTIERNKTVGGVVGSPHCAGLGQDVVYDGSVPGPEADTWLRDNGLRRVQESGHDHLQPADWTNKSF